MESAEPCAKGLKVGGELCPVEAHAPRTREGAAAWSLAQQPGVWAYGQSTIGAGLAGGITRQVATGINTAEAMARLGSDDPDFCAGVMAMLRHIEAGRAKAEAATTERLREQSF